ncbi:MAG: hypothetical protein QM757_03530 [Paludibaculum sp.]
MFKRLAAIGFIFVCTSVAWAILSATIYSRTTASSSQLRGRVESVWGSELTQHPPAAAVDSKNAAGVAETHLLPLTRSDLRVKLALQPRQKGLLWFSTYTVNFEGGYSLSQRHRPRRARPAHIPSARSSGRLRRTRSVARRSASAH